MYHQVQLYNAHDRPLSGKPLASTLEGSYHHPDDGSVKQMTYDAVIKNGKRYPGTWIFPYKFCCAMDGGTWVADFSRGDEGMYTVWKRGNISQDEAIKLGYPDGTFERHQRARIPSGSTVSIKTWRNKYMSAESDGLCTIHRVKARDWEYFMLYDIDGIVTFRSLSHNSYLCAEPDGTLKFTIPNRDNPWNAPKNRFTLMKHEDGRYSIKSYYGKFLSAQNTDKIYADRSACNNWEKFTLTTKIASKL